MTEIICTHCVYHTTGQYGPVCSHPKLRSSRDLLSGKRSYMLLTNARSRERNCGPEARYFKRSKIRTFFNNLFHG